MTSLDRRLHPDIADDLQQWRSDRALAKLVNRLDSAPDDDHFLSTLAEVVAARHLLSRGCALDVEIPTPTGRSADFAVACENFRFYLHIKRLNSDRAGVRRLTISSRLRHLERIPRPYVVGVRWREGATPRNLMRLVRESEGFIRKSRVGDELIVRDDDGAEIGGCKILAAWAGERVTLVIGLPTGFVDESARIQRLLRKAHRQFMPGALNVIMICSRRSQDRIDVENALLGSHAERWDLLPPRGHRVAHGRAEDGFWHGTQFAESQAAGWFSFSAEDPQIESRLWIRESATIPLIQQEQLRRLLT
jgi:hypothetical protein